mgnify:CR=1 FL=1
MSKEKRRVPKLRFPGFTEDWEQREFSDIFSEVKSGLSRMLSNDDIGLPVVRANNINDGQLNLVDDIKYWYKNDPQGANTNNYLIEQGDILINFINSEAKMGTAAYVTRRPERDTIYTTNILRCKVNDEYNPYFIYSLTFLNSYKNYIASITKPAVNQASFTTVDFKKYSIKIPTVKEQNQIADLIETFNKLITLHQRKLDNLKLKKKALLQKLFPKNGEYYPELRFPGFTDAWEQRKLTDIAKTFIGLVTTMTENYRDSGTLLIRNSDIKEGQFIFSEKPIHLDEEFAEKNKTRRLQIGDVVTVHTGEIGTSAVIKEKEAGAIGFATINTRTDKRILNPYFLSTYFNTDKHKCYANSVSTGDGRSNYNIKDFNKLVISIPTLDEQEKISAIINNINTIITLHQRKLDHLQLQKKALLQQMFV